METAIFLGRPQDTSKLRVLSWNINGVKTKLEKKHVEDLLRRYDIIGLYEIKTPLLVSFPGYVTFTSVNKQAAHRGGTAVLVKNYLLNMVDSVDTKFDDQVWIKFRGMTNREYGFCYIPPADSTYYNHNSFAYIQEKMKSNVIDNHFIVGDMNARFGRYARELPELVEVPHNDLYSYPSLPDEVRLPNDNAYILSTICMDSKLLLINNLKTPTAHYVSNMTYKKGGVWLSEIDTCLVSPSVLGDVSDFSVIHNESLPSDHAPISVSITMNRINLEDLSSRAKHLGDHAVLYNNVARRQVKRPINVNVVNEQAFRNNLEQYEIPENIDSIDELADSVTDAFYNAANISNGQNNEQQINDGMGRWENLLRDKDDSKIWRAIDWRGEYMGKVNNDCPSNDEFKEYFESTLGQPAGVELPEEVEDNNVFIPVLDEEITPLEVENQIKYLKRDKACGPDGVSPGLFKMLPGAWILTLVTLFNTVFRSAAYPQSWTRAKLFTIFKKGDKLNPRNYRGINVINSIAKVYDMVLSFRLKQWFRPFREQAGAQERRGCLEHIVTLRLFCDMAKRKRLKLYVTFIDFKQAYDFVPRNVLFSILRRMGCGSLMLGALIAMYRLTDSIIGTALISITIGVRQGSPTSCLLFIIFVNDLIKMIKEGCDMDGFLNWLHILVLMDDTVLLATCRRNMIKKLSILKQYCEDYGMIINQSKTKFFVINGNIADSEPLVVDELIVNPCDSYIYLGSPFTSDGSTSTAVKAHAKAKMCHVLKYVSFVTKNNDVPFLVKKRVLDACLMSSLIYGCESWLCADLKPIVKLYNWCLKQLLGVRRTTCNDVCYVESGYPPLHALIRYKQHSYFYKMWQDRSAYQDDPLALAIRTVIESNTIISRLVSDYILREADGLDMAMRDIVAGIQASESSRRMTYKDINPSFDINFVYKERHTINEHHRLSFTRFRVSGHSLAIETGRWNRRGRGRLPPEERLCVCGDVQDERHVIQSCPLTNHLRLTYNFETMEQLMLSNQFLPDIVCKIVHDVLSIYS